MAGGGSSLRELLEAHALDHLAPRLVEEEELTLPLLRIIADLRAALAELEIHGEEAERLMRAVQTAEDPPDGARGGDRVGGWSGGAGVDESNRSAPSAGACSAHSAPGTSNGIPSPGSLRGMRVAVIAHTGYFSGDSYGGATRASLALVREVKRLCGHSSADILALIPKPCPEGLVYALLPHKHGSTSTASSTLAAAADAEPIALGVHHWEEYDVLIGEHQALVSALSGRHYDVVLSLSIEVALLELTCALQATQRWAMAHNYYLPPFGPFRRHAPQPGHVALLRRMDWILSPCTHHCRYIDRWGPKDPSLKTQPLWAADYHYFHSRKERGANGEVGSGYSLSLPPPMRPWEAGHRFVTIVSPCPAKGLSVLLALARRMPLVDFAAVPTGWTDGLSREKLRAYSNITLLPPNDDVDVIFRQTRVLLAPSLWQECCPLIVMESLLRGVPCVSSDVFGMPEANLNHGLVCETRLCFDHARGELLHRVANEQLEDRLGPNPVLPDARQRSAAVAKAVQEEASDEEVAPFEEALRRLLTDEAILRQQSAMCRDLFFTFAKQREGGVARLLQTVEQRVRTTDQSTAGGCRENSLASNCTNTSGSLGLLTASAAGAIGVATFNRAILAPISTVELKPQLASHEASAMAARSQGAREMRVAARYRVTYKPLVYLRAAPSTRAAIITIAPTGTLLEADATLETNEGTWVRTKRPVTIEPAERRGWALVHGQMVGLGPLLSLESEGLYGDERRS